jgi:dimethylglycine dehydrogenase
VFGWERAQWFAPDGERERHAFRRSNCFDVVAKECQAVRERVGLLDLTSFSKYEVSGRDAEVFLQRINANRVPRRDGGIVLSHMLTELGGIECETTITRLGADCFYLLSAAVAELHDFDWLRQHIGKDEDVSVVNVTHDYGVLVLTGPRSREVLGTLTSADLSNAAFPWLRGKEIDVAGVPTRALRISYVGELGWELHHPIAEMEKLYDAVMAAGEAFGIANFGTYAVNALRMEKAYKAWGAELTTEISLIEAGMERFVDFDQAGFIGREATLARQAQGIETRLVYVSVDTDDADAAGNEPVLDGDRIVGITTGGAYGFSVGKSLAFAYVEPAYASPGSAFDIRILGVPRRATVLAEAAYDPNNDRLRA